ncbi:hypothetical protein DZA50_01730 [Kangiella sp. HD9-110m-PIT-SAG07]|nr:hypothetical protein DZA50_01730 [Kangiella sp. HD9-110m-PIT-SAG07]
MKSPIRIIIIALALFILQGCGLQFWYNRIAWLSTWYADDYVTLSSIQEERIETLVDKHATWHRTTQLPRYNQFIDDFSANLRNRTVADKYDSYGDRLINFYHTILDRVLDDAINELAQLSDEQVDELMTNINESAKDQSEEFLGKSNEERLEQSLEEATESYEEWFDDLTEDQEMMIHDFVSSLKPTGKLRMEYLKQWREAFSLALTERQSESGKKALRSLIKDPRQLRSPALINNSKHNDALRKSFQLELFNSASDEQIEHFIDYLDEYREDFSELIKDVD